ncbi:hypothetical protein J4H86_21235 [Spiractinospora alimapuensis]|uniref:hypothetical protein n=1 Tax=Spiractinospora alimapuensis TaxID=2820884 RepID=UPI001F234A41|nr:hypothetical protein [Spiractinospora alimapuensis]QVQ51315.1 hypothetical protein J4H86_21235 [Spiractinospora alimapuensis]
MTAYPTPRNHHYWWLVTGSWRRLHAVPRAVADPDDDAQVDLLCEHPGPTHRATCGLRAPWRMPGYASRTRQPRCGRCCDRIGIPRGDGTPANEKARQERLAEKPREDKETP